MALSDVLASKRGVSHPRTSYHAARKDALRVPTAISLTNLGLDPGTSLSQPQRREVAMTEDAKSEKRWRELNPNDLAIVVPIMLSGFAFTYIAGHFCAFYIASVFLSVAPGTIIH